MPAVETIMARIGSAMLEAMKRQISRSEITELINAARERIPGIALRTTLITGFPGETEDDVAELIGFLEEYRLDRVGIFTYSHEENTTACGLEDDVPQEVKEERAARIMEAQQEISYELNQEKVGKHYKLIIDKKEAGRYLGRTEYDSVEVDNEVIVQTDEQLEPGTFVEVEITKAFDFDLEGRLV